MPLREVLILIREDRPGRGGWSPRPVHPVSQLVQHTQEGVLVGVPDEWLVLLLVLGLQMLVPAGLLLVLLLRPASARRLLLVPMTWSTCDLELFGLFSLASVSSFLAASSLLLSMRIALETTFCHFSCRMQTQEEKNGIEWS